MSITPLMPVYPRCGFRPVRGDHCHLIGVDGRRYLDFAAGIAVNILGHPDNGVIFSGYLGGLLVAGAFLSVGAAMSALTRNQVIAFVLGVAICFLFAVASNPIVNDFLSHTVPVLGAFTRRIAIIDRFNDFTRGIIALRDVIYFATFIGFFLFLNTVLVDQRKAD